MATQAETRPRGSIQKLNIRRVSLWSRFHPSVYIRSFSLILICGQIFFLACFKADQNANIQTAETPAIEIPKPHINLAEPLKISDSAEDVALAKKIDELIERSEFSNARWGVFAVSLKDGRVVVAREARKLFSPASVQKVLTSVVALERLGADFRWKTSVFVSREISGDTLDGDLILYGQGAPDFDEQAIENLAAQIQSKGIRKITGAIVGDDSFFTGDKIGDGWAWNELQWYYGAEASALSVNKNLVTVSMQNGNAKISPETDYVNASANVREVSAGDIEAVGLKRDLGTNNIYIWGQGRNLEARVAVENPALWAAKMLKDALQKKGITTQKESRSADWKSDGKTDISNLTEIASVESVRLGEIVQKMNRDSVNLYAELILRTLGKKFGAEAPDENPKLQKTRGDDSAGASVLKKWLTENNIAAEEIKIHDGSGLSRLDMVTPEAVGRALVFAAQSKFADTFKTSLPVAAQSGTLRGRLQNVSGKIAAKTGSITYVNSLAGYANAPDETLVFVIFCNNQTRNSDSSIVIDAIASSFIE